MSMRAHLCGGSVAQHQRDQQEVRVAQHLGGACMQKHSALAWQPVVWRAAQQGQQRMRTGSMRLAQAFSFSVPLLLRTCMPSAR
jgi:hypothetical protein